MKKFLAIALVAMMLATIGASFAVSADAVHFHANMFNPADASVPNGSEGIIYTTTNTTNGWWFQAAFAPNGENWEVVELKLCDGTAATIPANGFVWALHDTGTIGDVQYIIDMKVGQIYTITGLDIAGLTCAEDATIALYQDVEGGDVTSDDVTSDDVTSDEPVVYDEFGNFWLSHYNDGTVEGAGVVYTDTDATGDWWAHAAFVPVEGYSNVYEIVEFANKQGTAGAYNIPEGGFVYGINVGNNWPALIEQGGCKGDGATGLWYDTPEHITYPNYAGINVVPMWDAALTWKVGDKFIINGLDLDNLTVPTTTPDVAWYEDSYVCTAQYKAFVEGDPDALPAGAEDDTTDNETSATSPAGDASSMIVFAVIALVAIAGSAVVIKTRK